MPDAATGPSPWGGDQPPPEHRSGLAGWAAALLALAATGAIVAVALAAPLLVDLAFGPIGPSTGGLEVEPRPTWIHLLAFQATVVVLAVVMADPLARHTAENLAWRPAPSVTSWLTPFLLTTLVSLVIAAIVFTFFADTVERDLAPIRQMVREAPLWLGFVALAIGAPLSEELLFRGYLLQRLEKTPLGFWGGALVANVAWTSLHLGYSWLSLADVFIAGLLFSWALWRTRSIWVPIAFHAIYNAAVFFIMLIPAPAEATAAVLLPLLPI